MSRIALVIPYIGRLPAWFPYFLQTCRHNSSIDFLFFSDAKPPRDLPANVIFRKMDLDGFNALASRKLGMRVRVRSGYKLCDFRPAFGVLFAEYLHGFDFWGHCDVDVVLGDLRRFLSPEVLNKHDVISCRPDMMAGPLSLYRNSPRINRLYGRSWSFRKVFSDPEYLGLDEIGSALGWLQVESRGYPILDLRKKIESITEVVQREQHEGRLRARFGFDFGDALFGQSAGWNRGKLVYEPTGKQIVYFHFGSFKGRPRFKRSLMAPVDPGSRFRITPDGFSVP